MSENYVREQKIASSIDGGKMKSTAAADNSHDGHILLPHEEYETAWICALYIEMAAARAMLDIVHDQPPSYVNDTNTYAFGSIRGHNIVIACLPDAQFGNNNAAHVVSNLKRTFPCIRQGLMVGIGGGVPGKVDIRLGDVVVGTRVMQYDLGRVREYGHLQRTAIPRIIHPQLGTAVSVLRSNHELRPSRIPAILEEKIGQYPEYADPKTPDSLYKPDYRHVSDTPSCAACDSSMLFVRQKRASDDPVIHYGAIASGNQLMRDAQTRDSIASELDIICFEMETAGLMDALPFLTIRGISDYSDSHKSKEWQRYAAATAAAYAREFLETLSAPQPEIRSCSRGSKEPELLQEHRKGLLRSLAFDEMDVREETIRVAHEQTCTWFLSHPKYQDWLDTNKLSEHHGFFWLCGKPGVGKSTIMKFACDAMRESQQDQPSSDRGAVGSFFFNARGRRLEKSIEGMYRSLLFRLFHEYPDLQVTLDHVHGGFLRLDVLKSVFRKSILLLDQRPFTCFIDALDECDEQQTIDMLQFFEDLSNVSTKKQIPLRICFSSRHYPYLDIQPCVRLSLDDQQGHVQDLSNYAASRLRVRNPSLAEELRSEILRRAAGGFLWVVLVINILNDEDRRGRPALRKRLTELPNGLRELFQDILTRDCENIDDLRLSIAWILYAHRPLEPEEYYHALWCDLSSKCLADSDIPNLEGNEAAVYRFITSSSKGLAEVTKTRTPTVQFIHESVRDFFLKDNGLRVLWPDVRFDHDCIGHEILKQSCNIYLNHGDVQDLVRESTSYPNYLSRVKASKRLPFLSYASEHVLPHANTASRTIPQDEFLLRFNTVNWIEMHKIYGDYRSRKYSSTASLLYVLADKGLSGLICTRLVHEPFIDIVGERYGQPLFAALANGHGEAAASLLSIPYSMHQMIEVMTDLGLRHIKAFVPNKYLNPVMWAFQNGRTDVCERLLFRNGTDIKASAHLIAKRKTFADAPYNEINMRLLQASKQGRVERVRLLLDCVASIDSFDSDGRTALLWSTALAHWNVSKLLIERGADIQPIDKHCNTALIQASKHGQADIVQMLLDNGAAIERSDVFERTPLLWAIENGHTAVAKMLIRAGADVDAVDDNGNAPLLHASQQGNLEIVRLLIDYGARIHICNRLRQTPLILSAKSGHSAVAGYLIYKGALLNASDIYFSTALMLASRRGCEMTVKFLVCKGADLNLKNRHGSTALHLASTEGHERVVHLLVLAGGDINRKSAYGYTPLLAASARGHESIVRYLIQNGADIRAKDKQGRTSLMWASMNGWIGVVQLLIDQKADIEAQDDQGWTPLMYASCNGHEKVAHLLISNEANVEVQDDKRQTALMMASYTNHITVVQLLIRNHANLEAKDSKGRTSLLLASYNGHLEVVRTLIHNQANINSEDNEGQTPLMLASSHGHQAVARYLAEKESPDGMEHKVSLNEKSTSYSLSSPGNKTEKSDCY